MPPEADPVPTEKRLVLRFWQSASGFWRTPRAWALMIFLISTILLQLLVYYGLNFWNRDFFNAVERKDETAIWAQATRFVWGKLEKMDTKVYDGRQTEVSRWNGSHTASTPKN